MAHTAQGFTQETAPVANRVDAVQGKEWSTQANAFVYLCCLALLCLWLILVWHKIKLLYLPFDDAYMFFRYAVNMHQGSGITWNPNGAHVYGVTSPAWLFVIWIASSVSHSMTRVVIGASVLAGVGAMLAMSWAVWKNARSWLFRQPAVALVSVMLCCITMFAFVSSAANGMETSFALGAMALLLGTVLQWERDRLAWGWIPIAGLLAFLSRPESALTTCLLIAIVWLYLNKARRKEALLALAVFFLCIGAETAICKAYFGSVVPLSFYVKSQHSYIGYIARWFPASELFESLRSCRVPLLLLGLFVRRRDAKLMLLCLVPAAATMAYLVTTVQIMGFWSRYYVPYSAFLLIPALLVLDRWLDEWHTNQVSKPVPVWARLCLVFASACFAFGLIPHQLVNRFDDLSEGKLIGYEAPQIQTPAGINLPPLPDGRLFEMMASMLKQLPAGSTVAASEVGYIAASAPQVNIIDLVGLNDTMIARHGFSMEYLLSTHPDLIWFPHRDYTHQRGVMISDPRLLAEYDFYPGAADFGIAIRKAGRFHSAVQAAVQRFWSEAYPTVDMESDRATSVFWTGRSHMFRTMEDARAGKEVNATQE